MLPGTCWSSGGSGKPVRLTGKNGVRYTVPQYLDPEGMEESVTVRFRVGKPYQNADPWRSTPTERCCAGCISAS